MIVNCVFRLFFGHGGHGVIYGREWLVLEIVSNCQEEEEEY